MSLKIAILMGGNSDERQVSLKTGEAVKMACIELGYSFKTLILDNDFKIFYDDFKNVDIVFNALHGGIGENGQIQSWFERNKIKYTGSNSMSSKLCMDKSKSKEIVKKIGFDTPKWEILKDINDPIKLKPPYVIKPNEQGSTVGITIVNNVNHTKKGLIHAFKYGDEIMIEEFIEGRELTVAVVRQKVYPIVEIQPKKKLYDYDCKYNDGMSNYICPSKIPVGLTREIKKSTLKIFNELKCNVYGRADFLLKKNKFFFLEMNTLPGLTNTSLAPKAVAEEGLSFTELIKKIIRYSLKS